MIIHILTTLLREVVITHIILKRGVIILILGEGLVYTSPVRGKVHTGEKPRSNYEYKR